LRFSFPQKKDKMRSQTYWEKPNVWH